MPYIWFWCNQEGILVLNMKFNSANEESRKDYIDWLFKSNKRYIRNFLLLYIIIYPIYSILDYYSVQSTLTIVLKVRLFVCLPFLVTAFILTYIQNFKPYVRIINSTALFIMNMSIVLMYAFFNLKDISLDIYYSGLIITIATLGISMSSIAIISIYICTTAVSFIFVSLFVHQLHLYDPLLFMRSSMFVFTAAALFIVVGVVIERFSIKLYKAQKNIVHEKDEFSDQIIALEQLNDTKNRFFRIISHDLRSPFTSLIGYFDILLRDHKKEFKVKKDDLEKIYLHTRRTYNLLNNLLNWSKTQLNKYTFKQEENKLNDIFCDNDSLYREIANQKQIKITHVFPDDAKVYCDKEMITTIVRNLLFNAIKYTKPEGEIFLKGTKRGENKMEIAVIDNGVGINSKDISKILNPKEHYTKKGTHDEKGAGIGLLMCYDLLKKHDTELQIESKKNVGSKFFFTLPIHPNINKNETS